ncbi:MAG: sugar phosphate isomerase/epimerase [Propionibacteriales bacterium]|nr:sugar phosphate isomerase/epimerase [Propionibacteriales bacterium]
MKFAMFTAATPDWTPAEVVSHLAEQGWDGVEWRVIDQQPAEQSGFWSGNRATWPLTGLEDNLDAMRELVAEAGLEISAIGGYATCHEHEDVERLIKATAALDAKKVRVRLPAVAEGETYPEVFERAKKDYRWVAEVAADHGVKALIELHHRTIGASASSVLRLIDGLDPDHVGVIHDMGNLVYEGHERTLWAAQMLGPYLAHVHVKNAAWQESGTQPDGTIDHTAAMVSLRTGQVDLRTYLAEITATGYDGWITCEDFSTDLPLAERCADNLAHIKECLPGARP